MGHSKRRQDHHDMAAQVDLGLDEGEAVLHKDPAQHAAHTGRQLKRPPKKRMYYRRDYRAA